MWAQVSIVLSQSTRLADGPTDRHTDKRTERPSEYCELHHMQAYGNKTIAESCSRLLVINGVNL